MSTPEVEEQSGTPEITYSMFETTEMYLDGQLITSAVTGREKFAADEIDDTTREELFDAGINEAKSQYKHDQRETKRAGLTAAAIGVVMGACGIVIETTNSAPADSYRNWGHILLILGVGGVGIGVNTIRLGRKGNTPILKGRRAAKEQLENLKQESQTNG